MPFTKQPHAEPIPGYRLIAPLGCGGFGEVWKCEAPGGLFKAIKFVYGKLDGVDGASTQAHTELDAIQHIKELRHPFLLSMDRVECINGELMIVSELADKNLHDLLIDCRKQGLDGIPRGDLLRYLAEAAEVLDLMNVQCGLQHLDVKPRNLFLVSNHVKVGDFGLVTSMAGSGAHSRLGASVTPSYAAPEVFHGNVSCASDQYSLACCYVELRTGKLPFQGRNSRQLLLLHLNAEPDLTSMPELDRAALARALAKNPGQRHASCQEFIRALVGPGMGGRSENLSGESPAGTPPTASAHGSGLATLTDVRTEALTQTPGNKKLGDGDTTRSFKGLPALPAILGNYQFVENEGSSPLADVWKAMSPDGRLRQVKFIYGFSGQAEQVAQRLRALQHPALPPWEVIPNGPGCLVLVNDFARETLRDRWQKCQAQKLPGIPRLELLSYLRTVAEVLDYLYEQHSVHHLSLNPRLVLLAESGLQIAEFGLAHLLWLPAGQAVAQYNARYAAPELFERQPHRSSDQYSLAIVYQELLTGVHPLSDGTPGSSGIDRARPEPKLDALPEDDRAAIARAVNQDPQMRWPKCTDLIRALEGSAGDLVGATSWQADALHEVIASPHQPPLPLEYAAASEKLQQLLRDLIAFAGGTVPEAELWELPRLTEAGSELQHKFRVGLPVGSARLRVDAFRQQCNGQLWAESERSYEFHVAAPTNFWQQWMGRQSGLEIKVEAARAHIQSATPIDVTVTIRALRCRKNKAAELLQDLGAALLEGLRTYLLVNSEKRTNDRLLWPHPVEICALEQDGALGPPIVCRGKDISLGGIGFYLPHELPTSQVLIRLPAAPNPLQLMIPATVVRAQRCADGWYDVGALFRLAALHQSRPQEHAEAGKSLC